MVVGAERVETEEPAEVAAMVVGVVANREERAGQRIRSGAVVGLAGLTGAKVAEVGSHVTVAGKPRGRPRDQAWDQTTSQAWDQTGNRPRGQPGWEEEQASLGPMVQLILGPAYVPRDWGPHYWMPSWHSPFRLSCWQG